jgi:hypothetical protein
MHGPSAAEAASHTWYFAVQASLLTSWSARTPTLKPAGILRLRSLEQSFAREGCFMPHDPALVADTKGWLRKAREDLAIAKELVKGSKSFAGGAVFHSQQAAEKAFKAFLVWHDQPFRKTHELRRSVRPVSGSMQL